MSGLRDGEYDHLKPDCSRVEEFQHHKDAYSETYNHAVAALHDYGSSTLDVTDLLSSAAGFGEGDELRFNVLNGFPASENLQVEVEAAVRALGHMISRDLSNANHG